MTFDGIKVNHGGLDLAADQLKTTANDINNRLNVLEDELAPLRSEWTGNAQTSYQAAKSRWDQAIEGMIQLLNDTSLAVRNSNDEYRGADNRGASRF